MTTQEIADYVLDHSRRTYGELSADAAWCLAESIQRGDRPAWLFDRNDFHLFGTL